MKAVTDAARLLRESNPVADDAFGGAAGDRLGQATFERITGSSPKPAPATGRSLRRGRLFLLAAAAAGVAVVAGLLPVLLSGPPRLTRPVHTPWEPARPLPRPAVAGAGGPAGAWRLASYLVSAGWRTNTAGPEPGPLTCPTATTCYVEGNNATSASGPADMDTMYVSYDGAVSWNALPVPAGITFTSALSCASAASCAAGALFNGQPVLAVTTDGAHSWTLDPLPAGPSQIFRLSCPTTTTCVGLATASAIFKTFIPFPPYVGTRFLITTDGGARFTASASPPGESMFSLSCPTARDCVAVGTRDRDRSARYVNEPGVVAITHDGGASWSSGTLPQNQGLFPPITCVDTSHCYTLGQFVAVRFQGSFFPASDLLASTDGGRTWAVRRLPASVHDPQLGDLACPSDRTCYASGSENLFKLVNGGISPLPGRPGISPVVVITHDAGLTWSRVTFAIPVHVPPAMHADPNAFISVDVIQCQPGACIALGSASQGSKSTAVYTYKSTP
jgi:photosystem II stability/assembly factor-like uncharacterized protein